MADILNVLKEFGPAGLQAAIMYIMLKFFGDRQDKIIDANERASAMMAAAIEKLTGAVERLER